MRLRACLKIAEIERECEEKASSRQPNGFPNPPLVGCPKSGNRSAKRGPPEEGRRRGRRFLKYDLRLLHTGPDL